MCVCVCVCGACGVCGDGGGVCVCVRACIVHIVMLVHLLMCIHCVCSCSVADNILHLCICTNMYVTFAQRFEPREVGALQISIIIIFRSSYISAQSISF